MNRLHLQVAVAIVLLGAADVSAAKDRPNVVLIMADDLNNNLGCYGDARVKSPSIDRLAARGIRFDRAYCQYPVCNPSRTSLLSGRRPGSTGVVDNVTPTRTFLGDAVFLPEHFRLSGYRTIKIGKIFHTGAEFEDPRCWDVDVRETSDAKKPPEGQVLRRQGGAGIVLKAADEDAYDGKLARRAVELLTEARAGEKPFFLAVGFRRPHSPYIAPEKYFKLYPPQDIPFAAEPPEHVKSIPPLALTYKHGAPALPPAKRHDTAAAYFAAISYLDAQVGVLLEALDRLNAWDNTIVVFISDHGYHLGEHGGLWHKMTLFEECARVPFIVAAPGKKGQASCARLVELLDLYPTLSELCRLKTPAGLEGQSIVPLLEDPARPGRRAAFTVVSRGGDTAGKKLDPGPMGRSVRTERYRYTEWPDGSAELYDHDRDPREYTNLAALAAHQALVTELRQLLRDDTRLRK
jgi:iduronate 2-sulfatase